MQLASVALERSLEFGNSIVRRHRHDSLYAFQDDSLSANRVLQIDGVNIYTEQSGKRNHFDAKFVQCSNPCITSDVVDTFTGYRAVRRQTNMAPRTCKFFCQPETNPITTPIGDDNLCADIRLV